MKTKVLLLTSTAALVLCLAAGIPAKDPAHADTHQKVSPDEALKLLKDGNKRVVDGKTEHPHPQSKALRDKLAEGQHPFAVVLGCADSRTSPELIFDRGLGDLFVIRVAGNVLNDETLGSIEYAVSHGTQLIVVLGHESCGAVSAAREVIAKKTEAKGHIQSLVKAIEPAVIATPGPVDAPATVEATVKANIRNVTRALRNSEPAFSKFTENEVSVVGAYYDLNDGTVEFLDEAQGK